MDSEIVIMDVNKVGYDTKFYSHQGFRRTKYSNPNYPVIVEMNFFLLIYSQLFDFP